MLIHELLFVLFSYLLGSIPFGFIYYYITEKKDIRKEGSGNIGATNVLRTKGKTAGFLTLLFDMSKGVVPILVGRHFFDSPVVIIAGGVAAVMGHLFPVYIKFRGGKGIASFIGLILVFYFPSFLVFAGVFLSTLYIFRYVSISSLTGVAAVSIYTLLRLPLNVSLVLFILVFLIIVKHHTNIKRLISGTEYKFEWSKNNEYDDNEDEE